MPIISRRASLFILSFSLFLLLTPALFPQQVFAQDSGGLDLRSILPAATQGGIGVILLIVILVREKKDKQQNDEKTKLFTAQMETQNETTKLAFEKYNESTQQLIALLKSSQEQGIQLQKDNQETNSLLTGTLSRLEVKLAMPIKCPFGEFAQLTQKEKQ